MADDRMKNLLMIREPSPSYPRERCANRPSLAVTVAHHHGNSEFIRGSIAEPGGDPARSEMAHRRGGDTEGMVLHGWMRDIAIAANQVGLSRQGPCTSTMR